MVITMRNMPLTRWRRIARAGRAEGKRRQALLDMGNTAAGGDLLSKVPVRQIAPASIDNYRFMPGLSLEDYRD